MCACRSVTIWAPNKHEWKCYIRWYYFNNFRHTPRASVHINTATYYNIPYRISTYQYKGGGGKTALTLRCKFQRRGFSPLFYEMELERNHALRNIRHFLQFWESFTIFFHRHLAWATLVNTELRSVDRFTIEMIISVFAKQVLLESTVEWVS